MGQRSLPKKLAWIISIMLQVACFPDITFAQPTIRFHHLQVLSQNLDSLARTYIDQGFRITPGEYDPFGLQSRSVEFENGTFVELATTRSSDPNDLKRAAIDAFHTHIGTLAFTVSNFDSLVILLNQNGIESGPVDKMALSPMSVADDSETISKRRYAYSISLSGSSPLHIQFLDSNCRSTSDSGRATNHWNRLSRITWILLTASPKEETIIRRLFSALSIAKHHEGCCDYWIIGPPDDRIAIRFELPTALHPKPSGESLSIEDGGVIFAY